MLWHLFLHLTGSDNVSGPWYGFWSGFGSDLTEFALLGGAISIYHQHNCSVKGCPRLAHHTVDGTTYRTCHRHATLQDHKELAKRHAVERPEQHAFFRAKNK